MPRFSRLGPRIFVILAIGSGLARAVPTTPTPNQMPFSFAENRGQADARVRAIGTGPRFKAWLQDDAIVLQQGTATATLEFAGAGTHPKLTLTDPTSAVANYLHGSDANHWQTNVPLFRTAHYDGVWPGIGITIRQDNDRAKAEYTVAPGTDIAEIRLRFDGAVSIASDGSLRVRSASGEFREEAPVLYQEIDGARKTVPGSFVETPGGLVGFTAEYDHSRPLTIDPTILFSGFFGGTAEDTITSVAVGPNFNVVVAGWTISMDLPTALGARQSIAGGVDAFVAGFSPVGGQLLYCTYLGGYGDDRAFGVAVDSSNNPYITGWTSSGNFPTVGPLQSSLKGARDAFVTKLNSGGNGIFYSTFLGGTGVDTGNAIAVDALGDAVIVGDTTSTTLPVTAGAFQTKLGGGQDAFVARLAANGASLSFLTYFGGNSTDHGTAVQIDPTGPIVIGGGTTSTNLPLLAAYQSHSGGGQDGFVAKFNATATGLVFSTYIGGSGGSIGLPEQVNAISIGPAKNIVAAGITSSTNFPTTGATVQPVYGGGQTDGFLTKFSAAGVLQFSTFLGGSLNDGINAMVGDPLGRFSVTGFTTSIDFPVKRPTQTLSAGGSAGSMDAFVVTLGTALNTWGFSTYLGGSGSDAGNAITIDSMTSIIVAGQTQSPDMPAVGILGAVMTEPLSSFVAKFASDWTLSVVTAPNFTIDKWHTGGLTGETTSASYGQAGDIPVAGDWTNTGVKRIGVFRSGLWILDTNGDGILGAGDKVVSFGQTGDVPIVGDWNGTGTLKLGLYRAGSFILDLSGHLSGTSTGVTDATFAFGQPTDIPVTGDWNASGTTKVGVFRNGSWLVDYNGDQIFNTLDRTYIYGLAGDIPITGQWDSAGLTRIGVYRAGVWILNASGTNALGTIGTTDLGISFGSAGMTPLIQ